MKEVRTSASEVTLQLNGDEIILWLSAINETLEALDDWEFHTRTGFEKAEFRTIRDELEAVLEKMGEKPEGSS